MGARPSDITIIDGAMGSELDRRGCDTSLPLWSTRALMEAPAIVSRIHIEYLTAGAQAITTNTFRTQRRTLERAGAGDRAEELTRYAVQLAREARDAVRPDALVLGSVAPLEDCYQPDRSPDDRTCVREHREMIEWLIDAGVDLILIETMNTARELRAAGTVARELAPGRFIASACARLSKGKESVLLSGEPLVPVLHEIADDAYAVGINCVPADEAVQHVRALRAGLPDSTRICCYANVGRPDDQRGWVNTDAVEPARYAAYAREWIDEGTSIIGGCCGTTPATIRAIVEMIGR